MGIISIDKPTFALVGGWTRLKNRLGSNNLVYQGSRVPSIATAITGAVQELVSSCEALGGDVTKVPKKPLTFSKLVAALEKANLLIPVPSGPRGPPGPPGPPAVVSQAPTDTSSFSAAFKADVILNF